jgi:hypothetical protein
MIPSFARGMLRGALVLACAVTVTTAGAAAAQAATSRLSLSALSFADATVDASSGVVGDDLTWTIKNTDPDASGVSGTVTLRMRSAVTGGYLGHARTVTFDYGDTCCNGAEYVSGTPQESTYRYTFPVPRYSDSTSATWEVTNVSATAGEGVTLSAGAAKLASFASKVVAATAADTSGPSVGQLTLAYPDRPYLYVGTEAKAVQYTFEAQDQQSGFWKGSIKLAGPAGQSITTTFTWDTPSYSSAPECGGYSGGGGIYDMFCGVSVTLPAGAAAGSWRVAQLVVVDNSGAQTTYKNPQSTPVTVTSDAQMTADNFAATPTELNNWRDSASGTITFDLAGARKGLSSVALDFDQFSGCAQQGVASLVGGKVTVPFVMDTYGPGKCTLTGLAITDGAGDVSVYGSEYGASDPGVSVHRVPDTTPPAVTGASLSITSVPESQIGEVSPTLTIQAKVGIAPIDQITIFLYDKDGHPTQLSFGGTSQDADGTITEWVSLPYWEGIDPGTYTVGFQLVDKGGLSSDWDMPDHADSQSVPGGPVTLTITPDEQ